MWRMPAGQGPGCSAGLGVKGCDLASLSSSSACALERLMVFSRDSEQMQDAGAAQPCSVSPPPNWGPRPGKGL